MNVDNASPTPATRAPAKMLNRQNLIVVVLVLLIGTCTVGVVMLVAAQLNLHDPLLLAPAPIEAVMVTVPAGEFTMGSNDNDLTKPAHQVYLSAFSIDKYEVTNAQYRRCAEAAQCSPPTKSESKTRIWYYSAPPYNNYPVIYVTWDQAKTYCEWVGKRLPTEAEWEKAARGTDGRIYPWGNAFDASKLNSSESRKGDTTAIGLYPSDASPYGALDMAGNVQEWVADFYGDYPGTPQRNPTGPSLGTSPVVRGGSWYFDQDLLPAAAIVRMSNESWRAGFDLGFRCAK